MKIICIILIILLFSIPALAMQKDKLLHFGAGASIYVITDSLNLKYPILYTALAGISKELYDNKNNGTVELLDVIATIAGGIIFQIKW